MPALVLAALAVAGCAPAPGGPGTPAGAVATSAPTPVAPGRAVVASDPVAVRIPAAGVESALLRLGITADGGAEVPQDYARASWFSGGGRPGGPGPTVLLGHVDSRSGPAVFHRLHALRPGDPVEVTTADGAVAHYRVQGSEQVPKDAFPTFAVFGATPDDVLRLVTCAGEFDRGAGSYNDNLVVHAVPA
ncbi:class F sortase [Pseudonocardia kunmingensis]|uniref:Sortase family protein n=1 Tax=Pseudonocardia kunmingensis TaxID=630975 RepID=A0A543DJT5_9PSEU|nr:class F sortase [Pseudonocardia kunmingensis]TQM09597.1 sortase family protein [Pseudonocardia kunmingensis]